MYFKSIEIENVDPIDKDSIEFSKNGKTPKPLIIVGKNGSGRFFQQAMWRVFSG
jgi:hypothetical protein